MRLGHVDAQEGRRHERRESDPLQQGQRDGGRRAGEPGRGAERRRGDDRRHYSDRHRCQREHDRERPDGAPHRAQQHRVAGRRRDADEPEPGGRGAGGEGDDHGDRARDARAFERRGPRESSPRCGGVGQRVIRRSGRIDAGHGRGAAVLPRGVRRRAGGADESGHRDEERGADEHGGDGRARRGRQEQQGDHHGADIAQQGPAQRGRSEQQSGHRHGRRHPDQGRLGSRERQGEGIRVPQRPPRCECRLRLQQPEDEGARDRQAADSRGGEGGGNERARSAKRAREIECGGDRHRQHRADEHGEHGLVEAQREEPARQADGRCGDARGDAGDHGGAGKGLDAGAGLRGPRVRCAQHRHERGAPHHHGRRVARRDGGGHGGADQRADSRQREDEPLGHTRRAAPRGRPRRRQRVREASGGSAQESRGHRLTGRQIDQAPDEEGDTRRQCEGGGQVGGPQAGDPRPQPAEHRDHERRDPRVHRRVGGARAEQVVRPYRPRVQCEQPDAQHTDRLGGRAEVAPPQPRGQHHGRQGDPADDERPRLDPHDEPRQQQEEHRGDADERDADDQQQHRHRQAAAWSSRRHGVGRDRVCTTRDRRRRGLRRCGSVRGNAGRSDRLDVGVGDRRGRGERGCRGGLIDGRRSDEAGAHVGADGHVCRPGCPGRRGRRDHGER